MFHDIYSEFDKLLKKFIDMKRLKKLVNLNHFVYN